MKRLISILLVLTFNTSIGQEIEEFNKVVNNVIASSLIDSKDLTAWELLNDFYEEALQSDSGMTSEKTYQRLDAFLKNEKSFNKHLIMLFIAYQDYVGETARSGLPPDSKFQIFLINKTEEEIQKVYGRVPVVILIYKSEAYNSDKQHEMAARIVSVGLKEHPNSIPLKVYEYLNTKSTEIKQDLIKNHSEHWMIKEFGIR